MRCCSSCYKTFFLLFKNFQHNTMKILKMEKMFRKCVAPCRRFWNPEDTHELCVICLRMERAQSALEELVVLTVKHLQWWSSTLFRGDGSDCISCLGSCCHRGKAAYPIVGVVGLVGLVLSPASLTSSIILRADLHTWQILPMLLVSLFLRSYMC